MPPAHGNKKKKEKKPSPVVTLTRKSLAFLIVAVMAVSMLFGAGSGAITHNLMDSGSSPSHSGVSSNGAYTLEDSTSAAMSISQITEKTQKSVVEIRTESVASDSWMREYVTQGAGSGVIISSDGYIMTNNHVIDGARKITVTTIDEKSYSAKLVGTDPRNDVAVLKIKAEGLEAATYGNSDQLQVGDLAVAIGNPLGELGGTVTSGIISSLDRQLSIDGKSMNLLQTDASINPGNSGGGLFNDDGQLIGLVVAKSSGSDVEGLGFAIPINTA
ncbi:MAG: trypsin-like peptidase domain-containing protein, partial [Eubacterium sp.]|nr:trypsin-like peptidase domain-containing protein [Candidatus Colimonas fimequi]